MSFSYRINPGSIPINDGNFLEDALTQVCLPLAAEALPPAVTTVRQAAQQQNSTSSTNTLYTCPRSSTVHSVAQRIDWFTVQLLEQRSHRKQTRLQRFILTFFEKIKSTDPHIDAKLNSKTLFIKNHFFEPSLEEVAKMFTQMKL
jgi:hypothetical protein